MSGRYIETSSRETGTVVGSDLSELYGCYPKPKTRCNNPRKALKKDLNKVADATKEKTALGKIYGVRRLICTGKAIAIRDDALPSNPVAFGIFMNHSDE